MLKLIARNGHVYRHSATLQDLKKTQGQLNVRLIGVNDASVLPVFCQTHDCDTFVSLEQAPFTGTRQQCFLLAYRALCHEFSTKAKLLNSIPTMKGFDQGRALPQQIGIQRMMDALTQGYRLSMRDMNEHKKQFDSMLAFADYAETRCYIVTFGTVPEILCSGVIYPECDFDGQPLQNLGNHSKKMELVTFSLIAAETGGAFVFAWHSSGDAVCRPLAASLDKLADDELPHAIVRFVLEFCENHYLEPEWWDNADQNVKNALTNRLQTSASAWKARSTACLTDDGLRATSWKVTGRSWL